MATSLGFVFCTGTVTVLTIVRGSVEVSLGHPLVLSRIVSWQKLGNISESFRAIQMFAYGSQERGPERSDRSKKSRASRRNGLERFRAEFKMASKQVFSEVTEVQIVADQARDCNRPLSLAKGNPHQNRPQDMQNSSQGDLATNAHTSQKQIQNDKNSRRYSSPLIRAL